MAKYKIIYDRENCIGAAACAAASPDYWEMVEDGKANLINSTKREDGKDELIIEAEKLEENLEAAEVCPVAVIKIVKLNEDGSEGEVIFEGESPPD